MNEITAVNYSSFEAQVISYINEGKDTIKKMQTSCQFTEKQLLKTIELLISKNIIVFNTEKHCYEFDSPIEGERVILKGNIILPLTVLRNKKRNQTLVTRGKWYEFPDVNFDVRTIIWDVELNSGKSDQQNQTLIDLIQATVLKEKKTQNIQLEEYKELQNKIIPYSKNIGLLLKIIGEEITDISIIFKELIPVGSLEELRNSREEPTMFNTFMGFTVQSYISTKEVIDSLKTPVNERNYKESIHLNHIFKLSDFVFSNNEIPFRYKDYILEYVKLTGVRKNIELSYYKFTGSGDKRHYDTEEYDINDGIKKIRELFEGYTLGFLNSLEFEVEMDE
jgi:hypothetical protein